MSSPGPAGQRSSLTWGSSAGSPPPGEAQAPPGALYIFPWLPLYFPSAETSQIKECLNLPSSPSLHPDQPCRLFFFFSRATKVERRRMDADEGVKCLFTHLKQPAVPLRALGFFYDCRREGGERRKEKERTREWRERKNRSGLPSFPGAQSVVIPWERRAIIIQRLHSLWKFSVC